MGTEVTDFLKQGFAAWPVEMCRHFVEQQKRHGPALARLQAKIGKDDGDEQGLLLAGRAILGGDPLVGVTDPEIAAVRTDGTAASSGRNTLTAT